MTRSNMTPANLARSAVEGMLCGLADAVDALRDVGVQPQRIIVIGGAAANPIVPHIARTLVDVPVVVPTPGEYVADGAARQAAWALTGQLPQWSAGAEAVTFEPDHHPEIREAYRWATQQ